MELQEANSRTMKSVAEMEGSKQALVIVTENNINWKICANTNINVITCFTGPCIEREQTTSAIVSTSELFVYGYISCKSIVTIQLITICYAFKNCRLNKVNSNVTDTQTRLEDALDKLSR